MSIKVRVSPLLAKVEAREDDGIGRSSEVHKLPSCLLANLSSESLKGKTDDGGSILLAASRMTTKLRDRPYRLPNTAKLNRLHVGSSKQFIQFLHYFHVARAHAGTISRFTLLLDTSSRHHQMNAYPPKHLRCRLSSCTGTYSLDYDGFLSGRSVDEYHNGRVSTRAGREAQMCELVMQLLNHPAKCW